MLRKDLVTVFVCVDIQESERPKPIEQSALPPEWVEMGFTADDVNAANAYAYDVALPNAVRAAEACRKAGFPLIFIHWGYLFEDGMDLDPEIYQAMRRNHGEDPSRWSGHIAQPGSQPARALGIQPGEYVLPKSGQNAFLSCNLDFLLRNLGAQQLIMVGGHTGACYGKTARTALDRGYHVIALVDATSDARESSRAKCLEEIPFDGRMRTQEFLDALR
ncbi:MAG: cysteine hydrolase [Candidatus Hydrogenedentes bacterium]|nr:cysteine hydrolase [Candidatus Hydrogenedentota bacterium]